VLSVLLMPQQARSGWYANASLRDRWRYHGWQDRSSWESKHDNNWPVQDKLAQDGWQHEWYNGYEKQGWDSRASETHEKSSVKDSSEWQSYWPQPHGDQSHIASEAQQPQLAESAQPWQLEQQQQHFEQQQQHSEQQQRSEQQQHSEQQQGKQQHSEQQEPEQQQPQQLDKPTPSAVPKTKSRAARQSQGARLWCHIFITKPHPQFDLVPMLIGRGGCNMRDIYNATDAKIRVRGRGSGHLEVEGVKEAPVPLMVAVTADGIKPKLFQLAVEMTISKLQEISSERLWKFGELSADAQTVLAPLLAAAAKAEAASQTASMPPAAAARPGLIASSRVIPQMAVGRSDQATSTDFLAAGFEEINAHMCAHEGVQSGIPWPSQVFGPHGHFQVATSWQSVPPHDGGYGDCGSSGGYSGYGGYGAYGGFQFGAPSSSIGMPSPGLWDNGAHADLSVTGHSEQQPSSASGNALQQPPTATAFASVVGEGNRSLAVAVEPLPAVSQQQLVSKGLALMLQQRQKEQQQAMSDPQASAFYDEEDIQRLIASEVSAFLKGPLAE
jgi:hypothetical protein